MNVLKARYPDLDSLVRYFPNATPDVKDLFRPLYTTKKTLLTQEILSRKSSSVDLRIFLTNLLHTCYAKNRSNILLNQIDMKTTKFSNPNVYKDLLDRNSLLLHLCQSNIWQQRRLYISDDFLIYLLSEFDLIECLSRKRQLFIQLSGYNESFYNLSYFITRTKDEQTRAHSRMTKFHTRKRTIQYHLHATKQGQQAHLTDLHETLIARNAMFYHVSKKEQFEIYHPIEKMNNGEMMVDAMYQSDFSKTFFHSRSKQEMDQIRAHLAPIFEQFRLDHCRLFLRRRSRLPLLYTRHHVPESTATLDQLVPLTTPVETVQNFVRIWLARVLPVELLGSRRNRRLFIRKMSLFIQLPRMQQYSLGDALRTLQLNKILWTKNAIGASSLVHQLYICHLVYFLMQYVLTLMRSYFYITEASSPSHPLVLVFYRHKIWHVIQQKSHQELIEKACPSFEQESRKDQEDISYLWKVRFVPKTNSVRYLSCVKEQFNTKENIDHLKYTNEILKYLRRHNSQHMGIATFNRGEMHRRWQDYCRTAPKPADGQMTYFLRSDVSNFYDSINLDYLDKALVEFLDKCEFNYNLYIHTIDKTQYRNGRLIRKKIVYWIGKEGEQMCEMMSDDTHHSSNGIFHDMIISDGNIEIYNKEKLLKYIRAQLYNSYLYTRHSTSIPVKTYRRTVGINHGLRIASMLGQLYLNRIDSDINFVPLSDEFAVRHEDDLLIISPHRYRLRRIQAKMNMKLGELHHVNSPTLKSLKTKTNIRQTNMNKIRPVEYWGSLVDIHSRQILVSTIHDTIEKKMNELTIKITRETGDNFRHVLINALCLRSHAYYFDRLYTHDETFVRNFYHISIYFLLRLHAICCRFVQLYSNEYIRSKSRFLFRTMRAALRMLINKTLNCHRQSEQQPPQKENEVRRKSRAKLKIECKYVFFTACIALARRHQHLFDKNILIRRFSRMLRKLKHLSKKQRRVLKNIIGLGKTKS